MSLWRVKHTLSPVVEYALVALVAVYGLFGIFLSSLRPFTMAAISPSGIVHEPIPLDTDEWTRHDNRTLGYAFAAPPGWIVSESDADAVRVGRSAKEIASAPTEGGGILLEALPLHERREVQNLAAEDFIGTRPALYDVSVDGVPALFAVVFDRGRVRRQAVYVPMGDTALIISSASMEPAAFATFVSSIKFYLPEPNPTP